MLVWIVSSTILVIHLDLEILVIYWKLTKGFEKKNPFANLLVLPSFYKSSCPLVSQGPMSYLLKTFFKRPENPPKKTLSSKPLNIMVCHPLLLTAVVREDSSSFSHVRRTLYSRLTTLRYPRRSTPTWRCDTLYRCDCQCPPWEGYEFRLIGYVYDMGTFSHKDLIPEYIRFLEKG